MAVVGQLNCLTPEGPFYTKGLMEARTRELTFDPLTSHMNKSSEETHQHSGKAASQCAGKRGLRKALSGKARPSSVLLEGRAEQSGPGTELASKKPEAE